MKCLVILSEEQKIEHLQRICRVLQKAIDRNGKKYSSRQRQEDQERLSTYQKLLTALQPPAEHLINP